MFFLCFKKNENICVQPMLHSSIPIKHFYFIVNKKRHLILAESWLIKTKLMWHIRGTCQY